MKRNPKQEGSALFDCIPQSGECPMQCNQCFYNRPGAFYCETPLVPDGAWIEECKDADRSVIVRMNCGHDSNLNRDEVIETAKRYENIFFNTSIARFDFPGPVVFTANAQEEKPATLLTVIPTNLMFVRLRVSNTNLELIKDAVEWYSDRNVPVILTFMAYYDGPPEKLIGEEETENYEYKIRHVNSYWCPKSDFVGRVMKIFKLFRNVHVCGKWCKDCRNCETFYWQTRNKISWK